ncbi:MAG: amino acid ABC transporter permease, partial [Alphaproteobacteria bacterium]|nr:amino acid ABC transporter permease [Alphaproteobacteria bacterium]
MPTRRQLYEAQIRRRAIQVAAGSTLAVVLAVVLLVPLAPGWPAVKKSFFNAEVFAKTFPGLLDAFVWDVAIFLWSAPLIFALGLL